MPSPFPGMNPFLEHPDPFHDFHEAFCVGCRAALVEQVRPDFIVKLEEHVYVHELSAEERRFLGRADVSLSAGKFQGESAATSAMAAPVQGELVPAVDFQRECFVEIRDRKSRRLVTVIELLSPSNKTYGSDRDQFIAKRAQLLSSTAHYVEIDLLRGGARLPIDGLPECDYCALVSRVEDRPRVGLWPIQLREPLPRIPIPLSTSHPDAWLDLQSLLNETYDAGGYEDYIYAGSPEPPLPADDAAWAESLLSGTNARTG